MFKGFNILVMKFVFFVYLFVGVMIILRKIFIDEWLFLVVLILGIVGFYIIILFVVKYVGKYMLIFFFMFVLNLV